MQVSVKLSPKCDFQYVPSWDIRLRQIVEIPNALNETLFVQLVDSNVRNHVIRLARGWTSLTNRRSRFYWNWRAPRPTLRKDDSSFSSRTMKLFLFLFPPRSFFDVIHLAIRNLLDYFFAGSVLVSPPLFLQVYSSPPRVYFESPLFVVRFPFA